MEPLRRDPQLHVGDWTIRYAGYRSKVGVKATAQEFLFLFSGAQTEGLDVFDNAERLAELGRLCAQAVHTLLYDRELRQSVPIIYPVVVALPGLLPMARPNYLRAVAGALMFANNTLSTEGQDQQVQRAIGQYGVNCETTKQGLEGIGRALTYTFATPQHVFLVRPAVARAMPLEVGLEGSGMDF